MTKIVLSMNLTTEQLEKVTGLAQLTIAPKMIAAYLELDEMEFMEELSVQGTKLRRAFYSGVLQQMIDTRAAIIKAAHNGSNPAQAELLRFIQEQMYMIEI